MHDLLERQVKHLIRLVDDLLDVSRITKGKIELRKTSVELTALIDGAIEITRPLITGKDQKLTVSLPVSPVRLNADAVRIIQVFANLLNNAARYTPPEGHLWLTGEQMNDEVIVRVRDNGIGIAPEELAKIFDLFEQAHGASGKLLGGLGVGLAIVRSLVEMHEGTVQAYSPGIGLGSEFVVHLPVDVTVQPESELNHQNKRSPPAKARRQRILVVDDNESSAKSLGTILRLWNHDVQISYDSYSALETARAFKPEVVLADLGLPQMNGFELCVQMRRLPGLENALFVAVTGYGQPADKAAARAAGFNQYLVKPIDPPELEELLSS
jgi:CheY-like chemotaxis protein